MNIREWLNIAALGAVAYAVYKLANKGGEAYDAAREKVADTLYKIFGPDEAAALGAMYYYVVHFAGGEKHAIPIKNPKDPGGVDEAGRFTFRGKQFVIRDKVLPNGKTEHWAFNP